VTSWDRYHPTPSGPDSLFVAYNAAAELGCHVVLKWPMPARILDLYVEHKLEINGRDGRARLIDALAAHGLDSIDATEKSEMVQLALRGGHYTDDERIALLNYCESDVDALGRLLPKMAPHIDLPRALLRGRYMAAVALMMHHGVPIDCPTLELLRERWEAQSRTS
jgi:DNA polymerase I